MRAARVRPFALTVMLIVLAALPVQGVMAISTSDRLDNIERKLDSRGLVDMLNRLEALQRNVQQLRGELEVQTHQMEELQRRQREQYIDIDRRLQSLETRSPGSAPPVAGNGVATAASPVVPAPPPTASTPATPPVANPAVGQAEYDTALAILREGRYTDAAQAFKQFLARNPNSSYASNASYWLGETYYVTRDFDQSLATFTGLVTNHPQSPKVSDSQLKIGYIHYEKKDWKAARQALESVVNNYAGTTAARLANDRLSRLKKEGH